MSTFQQFSHDRYPLDEYGESRVLSGRERMLGHLLLIAIILLAICLRSL